jgi:SAM-dependent methyltransferase
MEGMSITSRVAAFWDSAAASFDQEADHGLRDPLVRNAWAALLDSWLPAPPLDVLDLGCGTGSLSLLLAERGHRVTAVDLSPKMVALARRKVAARDVKVLVGDAAEPPVFGRDFDVVLVRHVVWTLPDPPAALRHWVALTRPGGRLVLVEGFWGASGAYVDGLPWTGGVSAETLASELRPFVSELRVQVLHDPALWGRDVTDERYGIVARV